MAVSKVTRSFPCTVEQLWQIVTDLTHTDWRSDLARVEVLNEAHFVEHTKSGYATYFAVTTCKPKLQKSPSQPHLHAVLAPPCRSFSPTFTH